MKRQAAVLALGAVLVLGACAENANSSDGGDGGGGTDDTITVAYSEGGTTLDPAVASDVTSDTFVLGAYDQLVTYARTEADGQAKADTSTIEPMLAESWDVSEDETSYTFHLRDDVTFHDGSELTADDVDATFDYIASSSNAAFLYDMAGIADVAAVDDHTVRIDLDAPNHLFLQILPMYSFSIINMDQVTENGGPDWLAKNTAGSGPYTVDSWDPATEAVMTRNEEYWGEAPAVRQVTMKFIGEASNRVQLLQSGEVDMALEVPPKDVEALGEVDDVTIDSRASNKILYFGMNNDVEPFDDPLVRQAISYAIPYERLVDEVMMGQASEMRSSVASSTPGWTDAGFTYEHDLDRARELLEEAGHPDGFEFDFTLGSGFQDWNDDAVLIQAELEKIGVTMNIRNMARPQFLDALDTGEVQAYISRWTSFVNDPGYHLGLLLTSEGTGNYVNYGNDDVDALWEQAATESDPDVRAELYGRMQETITGEAPWAYLYEYNIVVAHRDGVQGYTSYPDGIIRYFQLSLSA